MLFIAHIIAQRACFRVADFITPSSYLCWPKTLSFQVFVFQLTNSFLFLQEFQNRCHWIGSNIRCHCMQIVMGEEHQTWARKDGKVKQQQIAHLCDIAPWLEAVRSQTRTNSFTQKRSSQRVCKLFTSNGQKNEDDGSQCRQETVFTAGR